MMMPARCLALIFTVLIAACNGDSNNNIGIEPRPDLVVSDIEVSQGTQNLDNDMPLVANRWTIVRVYVNDANGEGAGTVAARLTGFRTCPAPGCPSNAIGKQPLPALTPWNQNKGNLVNIPADGGSRVNLEDSFWFVLPPSWRQYPGEIEIIAEVDPDNLTDESQVNNNTRSTSVRFHSADMLRLRAVTLHLHESWDKDKPEVLYDCNEPDFWRIFLNMFRFQPAAQMLVTCLDEPLEPFPHEIATIDIQPFEWDMGDKQICGDAHTRLKWLMAQENLNGLWHYVGLIAPTLGGLCNGWVGAANGDAVWLKMFSSTSTDPWVISGGQTLAHEIGHSRLPNPDHIFCKGNEGPPNGQADTEYPFIFPDCRFSGNNGRGFYGLDVYYSLWPQDVSAPTVLPNGDPDAMVSPPELFPLMGYLRPRWTDPYTYCEFLNGYVTTQGFFCDREQIEVNTGGTLTLPVVVSNVQAAAISASGELLLVSGRVNTTTGAGRIMQLALQPAASVFQHVIDDANEKLADQAATGILGRFSLEVLDDTGNVLYSVPITVDETIEEGIESADKWFAFVELLEFPAGASMVMLRDTENAADLDSRTRSASVPAVRFTSLTPGDVLDAGDTIGWSGSDGDGDELHYTLRYSPDGSSWHVIALDEPGSGWQLTTTDDLPGSTAGSLEVVVSDGFNTAADIFSGVIVPGKAPRIIIQSPEPNRTVSGDSPVIFAAFAQDAEDGLIDPQAIEWTSDISGSLGNGGDLFVDPASLAAGQHRITASVTDSSGMSAAASVDISFAASGAQ